MSLQVWLPLNGDLHNQGLNNINIINNGAIINNNGKIGKCYQFDGTDDFLTLQNINCSGWSQFSFACWCYPTNNFNCLFLIRGNKAHRVRINGSGFMFRDSNNSDQRIISFNTTILQNTWNHICCTYNRGEVSMYVNGILTAHNESYFHNNSVLLSDHNEVRIARQESTSGNSYYTGLLNDIRIYNHCLSAKEVEEISKGLVLHLPLNRKSFNYNPNIGKNLLIGSGLTQTDYNNMTVSNGSTDWTKYLRWYNGSKAIHSFDDGIDTILLNTTGNLGICFVQKASDIDLDPNSYYTLSCEAKCSKSGAQISMARSYYNTSNSWVWRGGSDKKNFNAVDTWQNFSITFKPDANTQYICYCFTCANGTSGGTDTFSIRHCKLEKGSVATSWELNSKEDLYETTNTDSLNTCYDTSGYSKNGIIIGNINFLNNSPCFSTYINLATTSSHIYIPNLNVTGFTNSYSISWWGKVSSYSGKMMWGFSDGCKLNGIYNGKLWNTGDGSNNPLYKPGTTTQVSIPSVNAWHHFVMVGNGSQCLVYQDGELWGQAKTYKSLSGTQIYMNGWNNSTNYTLADTQLSDFRIYATALTVSQVKELYNTSVIINNNERISRNL